MVKFNRNNKIRNLHPRSHLFTHHSLGLIHQLQLLSCRGRAQHAKSSCLDGACNSAVTLILLLSSSLSLPEAAVLTNDQVKVGELLIKARSPTLREANGHLLMDLFFLRGGEYLAWVKSN